MMVNVCWSAADLIHHSIQNLGETITVEKYCHLVDEMHQKPQHMCLAMVDRKELILLHDKAGEVEPIGLQDSATFTVLARSLTYRIPLFQVPEQLPS